MIFNLIPVVYSLCSGSVTAKSANPSWVRLAEVQVLRMSSLMSSAMGGTLITSTTASQFDWRCKCLHLQVKILHEVADGLVTKRFDALDQST